MEQQHAPVALAESLRRQGVERPDDFALGDLSSQWTFGELAGRAAALAELLVAEHGDGEGPIVVFVDRHPASVAAICGVLWAGRGVVPLPVSDPVERLREIIERVAPTLLIDATGGAPDGFDTPILRALPDPILDGARWIAPVPVDPSSTGLIIFTSGSTGRPKAVLRTMRDLATQFEVSIGLPGFITPIRSVATLPLHFVGGFANVVLGVVAGRPTLLLDPATTSPAVIVRRCNELGIERMSIGASAMRAFANTLGLGEALPALREVWPAGEPVDWSDVALVRNSLSSLATVVNPYGATEIHGLAVLNRITPDVAIGEGRVPLGRVVNRSGCRLEPLTDDERLGELIVRGEIVTGYDDDQVLTSERFGVDPDGVRFLRTGDLVWKDADEVLHHRGRVDDMVKINGKLVEPAEVESALRSVEGVRAAAVLPHVLGSGRARLIGFIEAPDTVRPATVRDALRELVPGHLVPARIMRVDQLPVTDRGKVDRAALHALVGSDVDSVRSTPDKFEGAALELVLFTARRLLEWDALGPDDHLWDAGFDSLGAIELLNELGDAQSGRLDPNVLVNASTCRDLADALQRTERRRRSHVVVLNEDAPGQPVALLAGAGGPALQYRPLLNELGDLHPVYVYEQLGLHRRGRRDRTIGAAASRALADLRQRQPSGPYVLVGHSWGGLVAHEMARTLTASGERVALVLIDTDRALRRPLKRESPVAPEAIRERRDAVPVWLAKYAVWRAARVRSLIREWRARHPQRVGSLQRYQAFYEHARHSMRDYRMVPLDIPVLLVHPDGSPNIDAWDDHPCLRKVCVGGDHNSMIHQPHVEDVADAIRAVQREIRR